MPYLFLTRGYAIAQERVVVGTLGYANWRELLVISRKFEGSSNRPSAKHNEEQRESRSVCE